MFKEDISTKQNAMFSVLSPKYIFRFPKIILETESPKAISKTVVFLCSCLSKNVHAYATKLFVGDGTYNHEPIFSRERQKLVDIRVPRE